MVLQHDMLNIKELHFSFDKQNLSYQKLLNNNVAKNITKNQILILQKQKITKVYLTKNEIKYVFYAAAIFDG